MRIIITPSWENEKSMKFRAQGGGRAQVHVQLPGQDSRIAQDMGSGASLPGFQASYASLLL